MPFLPIKTPICSSIYNRGGICFTVALLTLSPITDTLGGGGSGAATGTEYVGVYLVIAVSAYINIVCERVTNIVKDI